MSSLYRVESLAFILHRREYGESSRILSCFSREAGRVDLICKGCRKQGKASKVLEPFRRYQLTWSGKSELKTLTHADEDKVFGISSDADKLYCGLYLNELINGFVRTSEVEHEVFALYENTLAALDDADEATIQTVLRRFELGLLQYMGYGISLEYEQDGTTRISPDAQYGFQPEFGFFRTLNGKQFLARGDSIIALQAGQLTSSRQAREARNITRQLIGYYLPNTRIQSRKLFNG